MLQLFWTYLILFIPMVAAVTPDDVKACGSFLFGRVVCSSLNYFYRECIIPGATSVDAIKLGVSLSNEPCEFKETFGFRGNAVWVINGCSGEFYVCYDGVRMSTTVNTAFTQVVTQDGTAKPTTNSAEVAIGSNASPESNSLIIYIIVGVVVVVLVGVGLVLGCIVKRRQQRDKSRHLAEKRQVRITRREQREKLEEDGVTTLPLATRSLSVESVKAYEDATNNSMYEREDSVCSSRSSNSGLTSISEIIANRSTGFIRRPSSVSSAPGGRMKKGTSTPDIRTIGRMSLESSNLSRQSKNKSMTCSQASLESIREVCDRYKMFDIPLELKVQKQSYRRPSKYNTVGFSGSCVDRTIKSGVRTLPRSTTKAIVHNTPLLSPSDHSKRSSVISGNDVIPNESHYHIPDSVYIANRTVEQTKASAFRPITPDSKNSSSNNIYAKVNKPRQFQLKQTGVIYATVNKACLKKSPSPDSQQGTLNGSFSLDNSDSNSNIDDRHYAHLETFKPVQVRTDLPKMQLPTSLKATKF